MISKLRTSLHDSTLPAGLGLCALLFVAWLVYVPGLQGAFHFDDWANLPALGAYGTIRTWHGVVTYLLSGIASSAGRPLSLLSFLLDANYWPAPPEPFLYTNILIHLLNGVLVTWVVLRLSRQLGLVDHTAAWIAIVAAGLWLLHPLMVSTTLYVVQRMAMLAATFVLSGILCYLYGREHLAEGRALSGYAWMTAGVAVCGLLATLSKENGALLPLFVLNIEYFVLQHPSSRIKITQQSRTWLMWKIVFLYLPLSLLALYLLAKLPGMLNAYQHVRNFTLSERLLTEGRVVVTYLGMLLIPRAYTAGLYYDDFTISTGLLHPWTTIPSLLLIASMATLAWKVRKNSPVLALAISFYFSGQLLESTFIPLELFYEHRNYLPAVLLFFPLSLWIVTTPRLKRNTRIGVACGMLAIVSTLTYTRAELWGHPMEQAAIWARTNPRSARAQTTFALYLMQHKQYPAAAHILSVASGDHPDSIMIALNLLDAQCAVGRVTPNQLKIARHALAHAKLGANIAYHMISRFVHGQESKREECISTQQLSELVQSAMDNPNATDPYWRQQILVLRAELYLSERRPDKAFIIFKQALTIAPRPDAALYCSAMLGTAHYPAQGIDLLDYYETLHPIGAHGFDISHLKSLWLDKSGFYQREIVRVRSLLREDLKHSHNHATPGS